ncbi:hypothetical protein [Hydrogenophaga pseudoflava]|uniref:Uncharacterized protein n=1 Tax=Hydrogenophaga pseudoflava TaxID=47421 RepID=A0A4P6X093_HYDPS|nr:hypothetical protein [Hydrogenophaga pseudoflava]QBM27966.1 hypothetical protein HPF_09735 [Hydrogenophaga pseudoflava]
MSGEATVQRVTPDTTSAEALPSFRQAVNMALKMTTSVMKTMEAVRLADTDWDDDDSDADFSIALASRELARLSGIEDLTEDEFFRSWWQVYSVVSLADKAFHRDCIFKNHLRCFPESFRVLGEMVEWSAR